MSNKIILRIDYSGIVYKNQKICNWNQFQNAQLGNEFYSSRSGVHERYYILFLYSDQLGRSMEFKVLMTSTQDKSEEEIMKAIDFAVNNFKTSF